MSALSRHPCSCTGLTGQVAAQPFRAGAYNAGMINTAKESAGHWTATSFDLARLEAAVCLTRLLQDCPPLNVSRTWWSYRPVRLRPAVVITWTAEFFNVLFRLNHIGFNNVHLNNFMLLAYGLRHCGKREV